MIEPISTGWQCPICKRVYNPRQEMCLYCGGENKITSPINEWISTNPCTIDTTKGLTGVISLDTPAPNAVLKEYKENTNATTM